jgi:hypothetical protein
MPDAKTRLAKLRLARISAEEAVMPMRDMIIPDGFEPSSRG